MPCLLASKPQSFTPQITQINDNFTDKKKLFLVPLNFNNILVISGSQIIVFSSINFEIKEEVLLDFPVESFNFEPTHSNLTIKLTSINAEVVTDDYAHDSDASDAADTMSVTGKTCSWSLDCPTRILSLSFSKESSKLINCTACCNVSPDDATFFIGQPTTEIIKDRSVAHVLNGQLLISDKFERSTVLSSVRIENGNDCSLVWIENDIFIFFESQIGLLKVLKYPLILFAPPTNGCNSPLVCWSNDLIHVHRAGAICPTWYKLKNNEVWDVLNSPVGNVNYVQISADGSCLLVCGASGVAFCDFFKRSWQSLPFETLKNPKWLGSGHVVALTPDPYPQLILISRNFKTSADLLSIPIPGPETVTFIDTYNNWQLLVQTPGKIDIYAFDGDETCNFTLVKSISFDHIHPLKQAAYFKEALVALDSLGNLIQKTLSNSLVICEDCESFLVLSTGHLLINRYNQTSHLYNSDTCKMILISQSLLAVLPITNCFTMLTLADQPANFSLNNPLQSKFLLPILFANSVDKESLLKGSSKDPLYPLALEYILLESLGKAESLAVLDRVLSEESQNIMIMCRAIVSLTRKIEAHEASQKLFQHLPSFSPLSIAKTLPLSDLLNFLPYLAKSYFENVDERKEAIVIVLKSLFSTRSLLGHVGKVKDYLSAFADLKELFTLTLETKIGALWRSGRVFKAHELAEFIDFDRLELSADIDESNLVYKIDFLITPESTRNSFHSWLQTRIIPKIE